MKAYIKRPRSLNAIEITKSKVNFHGKQTIPELSPQFHVHSISRHLVLLGMRDRLRVDLSTLPQTA